ncbi:unnamed protein product [Gongylonema pulchrum]|uniref:Nuclear pore complex protein Nup85 n=1 Tax=Gongylonema pulchrum TaxID=637853 RepID=A0A183EMR1_9BILA|nr:unnamed protein product [Gongylonema pulchrum]
MTQELNSTVKGLIQSSLTSSVTLSKIMLHIVTFFMNISEWDFLLRSFSKFKSPFLDVAKMIGAYMTTTDSAVARQIAEGPWWQVMSSTFQDFSGNKRRNDGSLIREQGRQLLLTRMQFLELLRLIKEQRTLSFLISFIGKMFNAALLKNEPTGSAPGQEIYKGIFVEHSDYWLSCIE